MFNTFAKKKSTFLFSADTLQLHPDNLEHYCSRQLLHSSLVCLCHSWICFSYTSGLRAGILLWLGWCLNVMIPCHVRDPHEYSRIYSDLGKTRPSCVPPSPLSFNTHTHKILLSIILTKRLEKVIFNPDIEIRWSSFMSDFVPFSSLTPKRESLCQVPLLGKCLVVRPSFL